MEPYAGGCLLHNMVKHFASISVNDEYYLLRYNAVQSVGNQLKFRRNISSAFTLVSCSVYSTLKIEAICSSETLVAFHRTTRSYTPEDISLHNHRCNILRPYTFVGTSLDSSYRNCTAFMQYSLYMLINRDATSIYCAV
jgi:hypothetical protein